MLLYNTKAEAEFNSRDGAGDCEGHTTHVLMGLGIKWILTMLLSLDGNHFADQPALIIYTLHPIASIKFCGVLTKHGMMQPP